MNEPVNKSCDNCKTKVHLLGGEVSRHKFVETELIHNCTEQILECQECGEISIGW